MIDAESQPILGPKQTLSIRCTVLGTCSYVALLVTYPCCRIERIHRYLYMYILICILLYGSRLLYRIRTETTVLIPPH
jgi:hypothetical protein